MISNYKILGTIKFSQSLPEIRASLEFLRQEQFSAMDRIVIDQDIEDEYSYIDGVGAKLIAIQKIINQVDISNCFILLITCNTDIRSEINFVTQFYSIDSTPIEFCIVGGQYHKQIRQYSNTACSKLWNHLYVGTDGNVNPCCLADHRFPLGNIDVSVVQDIITAGGGEIRSNMSHGYRTRACSTCYEKEDRGIQSMRQVCYPTDQVVQIRDLDIRLDNICNFKCRMCNEYFSSAIQQETIELYGKKPVLGYEKISLDRATKQIKNQRLEKILPFVTLDLESIYFAGGEPLITSEHYEILDRLIEIQNTNLSIRYNTNLSTLSYKQLHVIDKWCQFTDVTVGASIDASGAVAEYMRHGTVWSDIVTNIHVIKSRASHVKLKVASVVSCLTVENLIDLQNAWIDQQLFGINDFQVQVLTSPNFLSPAVLPQHHKDRLSGIILEHIQRFAGTRLAKQWQDVLQWMNHNDYTFALKDFAYRTRVLDSHRDELFEKVFPEFKDLYEF